MSLRTLMQAGPAKTSELFVKLSDTSESAVKTREKLFAELKAELELHTGLEEQHLFPVLRRNAETKELVAEAIKDNKALRTQLAELDARPKNDEAFPQRLKALQAAFRQHARDEKRELLPAVQRALSEEQVQGVAQKIEAGVAEAGQAKHDEAEARRAKAREEREAAERQAAQRQAEQRQAEQRQAEQRQAEQRQAEQRQAEQRQAEQRQAEQRQAAERARQAAVERAQQEEAAQKRAKAREERAEAERQAQQEAAAQRAHDEAQRRAHAAAEAAARAVTAPQAGALRIAETAAASAQRISTEIEGAAATYMNVVKAMVPDLRAVASLPQASIGAAAEIRSAWMEWMGQATRAGTEASQDLVCQAAERQRRFAAEVAQGWMEHNARVVQIAMRVAQQGFRPFASRAAGSDAQQGGR